MDNESVKFTISRGVMIVVAAAVISLPLILRLTQKDAAHSLLLKAELETTMGRYNKALELAGKYQSKQNTFSTDFLVFRGKLHLKEKQYKEAVDDFQTALFTDPDNHYIHMNLAWAQEKSGNLYEAVIHYTKALYLNPHSFNALFNRAHVYEALGNMDKARNDYIECLKYRPLNSSARYNLGIIYMKTGNIDEAVKCFSSVLKNQPDHLEARNNRGVCYFKISRFQKAYDDFSQILKIDPGNRSALSNLTVLKKMKPGKKNSHE